MKSTTKYIIAIFAGVLFLSTISYGQNSAPVLTNIGDQATDEDISLIGLTVVYTDVDVADNHVITWVSSEPNVTVENLSGNISGSTYDLVPATGWNGIAQITITVTDNGTGLLSDYETYTLTVNAVNDLPTVVTNGPSDIYETIIVVFGEVTDEGGSTVTDRGMCLSLSPDPGLDDIVDHSGSGIGFFTSQFSYLMHSTTYFYRAFATNAEGTAYGEILSATTMTSDMTLTETISHVSCYGADDGSIDISITGGNPPYTYSWSNGASTQNLSSLAPGTYSVFIYDAENDQIAGTFEVLEPPEISILGIVTDVTTCNGDPTGSIQLTITGGTAPYTIEWEHGPTIVYISDLDAGIYDVLVRDANSCEQTASFNVSEPDALSVLTVDISDETCIGCEDGSIVAAASGGTPPYVYHLTGPDGFSSIQNNGVIAGLSTGDYNLEVTDISDCTTGILQIFVGNPLVVTNTDDSGAGSLRNAIETANAHPGMDEIRFNMPDSWVYNIEPASSLPVITDPLVINGLSQPGTSSNTNLPGQGFNTDLNIVIEGSHAGEGAIGLVIDSDNCEIIGLIINRFSQHGISVQGNNNLVSECFIGVDSLGNQSSYYGNGVFGIEIISANNNEIRNCIISDNGGAEQNPGILISGGSTLNLVAGNLIGTDISGTLATPNSGSGINIGDSPGNTIGGITDEDRNIIYGGIQLGGETTIGNRVIGNYCGPDVSGLVAIDQGGGITIGGGASNNEVGPGNVISGNVNYGLLIIDQNTTNNKVFGNYFGLAADGDIIIGNTNENIVIESAMNNRIGGLAKDSMNVISGSGSNGITIFGGDIPSTGNHVLGNYIGTNAAGDQPRGNQDAGVYIGNTSHHNTLGPGNLISGNGKWAIYVDSQTDQTHVTGNLIGTNYLGTSLIVNQGPGIRISGPNAVVEGNTFCGAQGLSAGVMIAGFDAINNTITGNYIGTNFSSQAGLGNNGDGVYITSGAVGNNVESNIISGNNRHGILIIYNTATQNSISSNKIGTTVDGTAALGNGQNGIHIENAPDNTIGPDNVISGNEYFGVRVYGANSIGNKIIGNRIGTNENGSSAIPNMFGLAVIDADDNIIGGTGLADRNIISGNEQAGINISGSSSNTRIMGNFIGTDLSGKLPIPNIAGISCQQTTSENYIGTSYSGAGNLIAFNSSGIFMSGTNCYIQGNILHNNDNGLFLNGSYNTVGGTESESRNYFFNNTYNGINVSNTGQYNLIERNYFGMDLDGQMNQTDGVGGIRIDGSDNIVRGNLISGYSEYGIRIGRAETNSIINGGNLIDGNTIGLNASGDKFIPNEHGIVISRTTDNVLIRNVIAGNSGNGIRVSDPVTLNNQFTQNQIYSNGELGIDLSRDGVTQNDVDPFDPDTGPNNLQNFPILESVSFADGKATITGSLNTELDKTYIIEFFSSGVGDDTGFGEGEFYLGSETVLTSELGNVQFTTTLDTKGYGAQVITATATGPDGNTSEFSQVIGGDENQIFLNMPFRYTMNSEGLSTVSLADYQNAIRSSFQTWDNIPTADIQMVEEESSDEKYANATDGLNLISFQDDRFPFATGVLAVTAKTLRMTSGGTVAEILDADIIFNPAYIHDPVRPFAVLEEGDTETVAFDIQSITTHEIGHALGMIHSGVYSSTMFFMLGYGTTERELDKDDMAWAGFRYPSEDFQQFHGLISGRVTYGDLGDANDPSTHPPVAGALVLAINTDTQEQFHAYTDADGNYTVPIPMESESTDEFWIHIQPLDGDVYGTPLRPANISPYIYSHTMYTDFPEEFYDDQESSDDNPGDGDPILVTSEGETVGWNLITNQDLTPPTVIGTSLDEESEDIAVSPTIAIKFSEPVDIYSFDETTCFLERVDDIVGGEYTLLADSTHIVLLKPVESLQYSSSYTLNISGITDLKGNVLAAPYFRSFTTLPPDLTPPTVYDVIPAPGESQVDVTKPIKVFFSEPMNKSSVESDLTLMTSSSVPVAGNYTWNLANKEVTFIPDHSLDEGTDYLINLSTLATDLSGNSMEEDTTFTFSTVDVAVPQILYLGPEDGSSGITVETPVAVKFSEPMDLASFTATSFSLVGTDAVSGTFDYLDDDRTIVFRPDQQLDFDQQYMVTLTSAISDKSNPKQNLVGLTSSFRTAAEPVAPHIIAMEPAYGAVGAQTTIIGSGFDPVLTNNIVSFDGTIAKVTNASLESVTVDVPYGAEDGPVTVIVNEDLSDNSFEFDVVPPNTDPSYNVIASSKTGSRTRAVVINPDAGYAYVTNWGDNTVTPINISGFFPVPETDIPVGIEPMDIDLNAEGTLAYVTNFLSNSVSVIGTKLGESSYHLVTKEIPVGYHPYGVAASSDKKVYVANNESEYVSVIDVDPNSGGFDHVIANVKTGSKNRSIVVTPDAGLILVTGEDGVKVIDRDAHSPSFNDVIASASKGSTTRHITLTPDAALALATTEDGVILIIDIFQPAGPQFGNVIASVKTGSSARNINISPDAMYVYITNPDENTVSVYQLDYSIVPGYGASLNTPEGLVHIATIEVDDTPYAIAGHPNTEYILVTHDSEEGGVSKIGIEEEFADPIYTLDELIASVADAINNGDVALRYGKKLLTDLGKALERIQQLDLESASDQLYTFIEHVNSYMRRGAIPETLGNIWLDAAYRLYEQLVKYLEAQQSLLKSTGETTSGIISLNDSQNAESIMLDLPGERNLKLENRPNPFSYHTQVYFEIPDKGQADIPVIMRVFNTGGQVVKTLVHMNMEPGRYSVIWNSNLDDGGIVPDGIYLLELMTPVERKTITISVIK